MPSLQHLVNFMLPSMQSVQLLNSMYKLKLHQKTWFTQLIVWHTCPQYKTFIIACLISYWFCNLIYSDGYVQHINAESYKHRITEVRRELWWPSGPTVHSVINWTQLQSQIMVLKVMS